MKIRIKYIWKLILMIIELNDNINMNIIKIEIHKKNILMIMVKN